MLGKHLFSIGRALTPIFKQSPLIVRNNLPKNQTRLLSCSFMSTMRGSLDDDEDDDMSLLDDDELSEVDEEEEEIIFKEPTIDELGRAYGTGRRKTSVARVWIKEGSGEFIVNDREFVNYFQAWQRMHALEVFQASKTAGHFDVWCTVKGGGLSGQAGAIRLGISRALEAFNPSLRPILSQAGMLTRDSRRVERKKPGQKKARKQFQWVKR